MVVFLRQQRQQRTTEDNLYWHDCRLCINIHRLYIYAEIAGVLSNNRGFWQNDGRFGKNDGRFFKNGR